jgi:hypothetical protein
MSLVPYVFRPRNVIRRVAIRRSVTGGSVLWSALAMYFVRGPARVRSSAFRLGFFGGNRKWQAVGVLLLLTRDARQVFGRQPEALGSWKVGPNGFVDVINAKPMSKKELKRSGTTKNAMRAAIIAQAVAATSAKNPDAKIVVKTK